MSLAVPRLTALGSLSICAVLAGCASQQVAGLPGRKASAGFAAAIPQVVPTCRFSVESIDDQRDTTSLGHIGVTRIDGQGFTEWFADGIATLPGYSRAPVAATVQITILKAYIQGLATLKSANLVVRLQSSHGSTPAFSRHYRGFDGSMNWANGEREIQVAFDRAMVDLTTQIAADMKDRCSG